MDTMTYAAFAAFRGYVAEKENPPSCFLKAHADLPPDWANLLGKSSVRKVPRHL